MASISLVNPKAEVARANQALSINVSAAVGLQEVMATNLGPKGTMKMLVSGSGDIRITKDGVSLLAEMQIQHPTASLIARTASAQDEIYGDGTTSVVLLIGELMKQSVQYLNEGLHPRILLAGMQLAKSECIKWIKELTINKSNVDRDTLLCVARSCLATKISPDFVPTLTDICTDAVLFISDKNHNNKVNKKVNVVTGSSVSSLDNDIDLYMVEIVDMVHQSHEETKLVKGLVLDHGGRHPDMPKSLKNAFILTCNVSFEYDKTEVNSGFFYKTSAEREKMVVAERDFVEKRVEKVLELKRKVLAANPNSSFVVITQKGIDPGSLDLFARENILALRRAKRRNMERLTRACGGEAMNSVDELTEKCLGWAGSVRQVKIDDDNYTFIEETPFSSSVTVLIQGPSKYTTNQIKDAVRDGLRAVKNVITTNRSGLQNLLPGAGSVECFLHQKLLEYVGTNAIARERYGVKAFADALLIIPKSLVKNAGLNQQEVLSKISSELVQNHMEKCIGVSLNSGECIEPTTVGIYDNTAVKINMLESCVSIAGNLLLVDEILRAGLSSLKGKEPGQGLPPVGCC